MNAKLFLLSLVAVAVPIRGLIAQNAERYSVQFSALYNALSGDDYTNINAGLGGEAQIRRQLKGWSLGGGIQYTRHGIAAAAGVDGDVSLKGVFLEPRYVLSTSSEKAAPYVSARLAFLKQAYATDLFDGSASGFQGNVGGGILVALTAKVNLDLGGSFGVVNFGEFTIDDPNVSVESGSGSGTNLVLRVGLSIGLGR